MHDNVTATVGDSRNSTLVLKRKADILSTIYGEVDTEIFLLT